MGNRAISSGSNFESFNLDEISEGLSRLQCLKEAGEDGTSSAAYLAEMRRNSTLNADSSDTSSGKAAPEGNTSPSTRHEPVIEGTQSIAAASSSSSGVALDPRTYEFVLERGPGEAWGFAWHVGAHADKRLVVAGLDPASPAGHWSASRRMAGEEGIQRGDELVSVNGTLHHHAMRHELVAAEAALFLFRRGHVASSSSSSQAVHPRAEIAGAGRPAHSAPRQVEKRSKAGDSSAGCVAAAAAHTTSAERHARGTSHQEAAAEAWRAATQAALGSAQRDENQSRPSSVRVYVRNTFLHVECDNAGEATSGEDSATDACPGAKSTSRLSLSDPLSGGGAGNNALLPHGWQRSLTEEPCADDDGRDVPKDVVSVTPPEVGSDSPRSSLSFWSTARSRSSSGGRSICLGGDEAYEESICGGRSASPELRCEDDCRNDPPRLREPKSPSGRRDERSPANVPGSPQGETSDAQSSVPRSLGAQSRCPSTDWDYPVSSYIAVVPHMVPVFPGGVQMPAAIALQPMPADFNMVHMPVGAERFRSDSELEEQAFARAPAQPAVRSGEAAGAPKPARKDSGDASHSSGPDEEDQPAPRYKPTRRAGRRVQRRRVKRQQKADLEAGVQDAPAADATSAQHLEPEQAATAELTEATPPLGEDDAEEVLESRPHCAADSDAAATASCEAAAVAAALPLQETSTMVSAKEPAVASPEIEGEPNRRSQRKRARRRQRTAQEDEIPKEEVAETTPESLAEKKQEVTAAEPLATASQEEAEGPLSQEKLQPTPTSLVLQQEEEQKQDTAFQAEGCVEKQAEVQACKVEEAAADESKLPKMDSTQEPEVVPERSSPEKSDEQKVETREVVQEVPADCSEGLLGKRVLIVGLVKSPEFNGCWGTVEAYEATSNRCTVRIFREGAPPVLALLRRDNVTAPPEVDCSITPAEVRPTQAPAQADEPLKDKIRASQQRQHRDAQSLPPSTSQPSLVAPLQKSPDPAWLAGATPMMPLQMTPSEAWTMICNGQTALGVSNHTISRSMSVPPPPRYTATPTAVFRNPSDLLMTSEYRRSFSVARCSSVHRASQQTPCSLSQAVRAEQRPAEPQSQRGRSGASSQRPASKAAGVAAKAKPKSKAKAKAKVHHSRTSSVHRKADINTTGGSSTGLGEASTSTLTSTSVSAAASGTAAVSSKQDGGGDAWRPSLRHRP